VEKGGKERKRKER